MIKFLLWCILLVLCWPLGLVALALCPLVWLLLLPFRVVKIAVGGVLELVEAIFRLPRGSSAPSEAPRGNEHIRAVCAKASISAVS